MSADIEKVRFLKMMIGRKRRLLLHLLLEQDRLRAALARRDPEAEQFRECAMSPEVWRMVKPVADMIYDGQWVSDEEYALVRDVLLDHAEEFVTLLEPKVDRWMDASEAGEGEATG